jgi:hypothetical protein
MDNRQKLKALELDITRLRSTSLKGLKGSQRASIYEAITELQVQVATILNEDVNLSPIGNKLQKQLTEFEDDLDSVDEPVAAATPPPADDTSIDDVATGESEDAEIIANAADKLRSLGQDDPEATDLADELQRVADGMSPEPAGDEGDEMPNLPPPADDAPMAERKAYKAYKLSERLRRRLSARHGRLAEATAQLLERHKAIQKHIKESTSNQPKPGEVGLEEALQAAKDLAVKYNRDMMEFGTIQLERTQNELFEAHKAEFQKCTTWEAFTRLTEKLVREQKKVKPVTESANAPAKGKPAPAKVTESIHPSVAMMTNVRRRTPGYVAPTTAAAA